MIKSRKISDERDRARLASGWQLHLIIKKANKRIMKKLAYFSNAWGVESIVGRWAISIGHNPPFIIFFTIGLPSASEEWSDWNFGADHAACTGSFPWGTSCIKLHTALRAQNRQLFSVTETIGARHDESVCETLENLTFLFSWTVAECVTVECWWRLWDLSRFHMPIGNATVPFQARHRVVFFRDFEGSEIRVMTD